MNAKAGSIYSGHYAVMP